MSRTSEDSTQEPGIQFLDARISSPTLRGIILVAAISALILGLWALGLVSIGRPASDAMVAAPGVIIGCALGEAGVTPRSPKAFNALAIPLLTIYVVAVTYLL